MKGYSQDLYILAFDHRGTITKGLLGVESREPTQDEANKVSEMKQIIFDGFLKANEYGITGGDPAILVDETFAFSGLAQEELLYCSRPEHSFVLNYLS